MDIIDQIALSLKQRGNRIKPVSSEKISLIEEEFNVKLPGLYKKFLLTMGKEAGEFMQGTSAFFDVLSAIREGAGELIVEHELPPLPTNAFVFWMHQGYQFAFFETHKGDDPPVYYFSEGNAQTEYTMINHSLGEFFKVQLGYVL